MKCRRGSINLEVIASVITPGGVRLYIPEKGRKDGHRWVQPYTYTGIGYYMLNPLVMSEDAKISITICFEKWKFSSIYPFTAEMARKYSLIVAETGRHQAEFAYSGVPVNMGAKPISETTAEYLTRKRMELILTGFAVPKP